MEGSKHASVSSNTPELKVASNGTVTVLSVINEVVMEAVNSNENARSVIIELEYESTLSAGMDAAKYYLSKSVNTTVLMILRNFCRDNDVPELETDHTPLVACLSLVMMQDESYSKVEMLRAAVANEYRIRMLSSPTTHETVSLLFRDPSVHLKIVFKGGKNYQYSESRERIVAANLSGNCPGNLTLNYFQFLGPLYSGYLVPSCTPKNTPNQNKPVSYSGALSDMKQLMTSLGYDANPLW
uniref:Uncharacterized protein n=1 Tax=Daphnia galeata TaxID=27404 RepID=A0A8J2RMV5_9CRUS|nr:unnamed protein product [Daphnia galeata]